MNSLNSSLVDAGKIKAVSLGVDPEASIVVNELRNKKLNEPALLGVAVPCVIPPVGAVGGLVWPLGAVEAR